MPTADRLYWLHAISPVHAGAGRGDGYIDLPLIREKANRLPFIPGSSVKGVLADALQATEDQRDGDTADRKVRRAAFGASKNDTGTAGAFVFTDARLVCLPVRSLYGQFAWCTCPMVLRRLQRDIVPESAGLPVPPAPTSEAKHPKSGTCLSHNNTIYLEDLDITSSGCEDTAAWATWIGQQVFDATWQSVFAERFVILPDNVFSFLAETGTEVQAHIRIDPDFKRVASGALWYEENLPAEAILAGLIWCDKPRVSGVTREDVLGLLADSEMSVQMGGKASTGKGLLRMRLNKTEAGS